MIIEDRDSDGCPSYSIVCIECGTIFPESPGRVAMTLAIQSEKALWDCHYAEFYCPECSPGRWKGWQPSGVAPRNAGVMEWKCDTCGKTTKRKEPKANIKCRRCGTELWPGDIGLR